MAITVKHAFVSAKGDGSDATLVRPSNWNENHDLEMATNRIIGRLTAGPGDAEEIPVTSYMMGILNNADYATLALALGLPTTGDARLTFKSTAPTGWVLANDGSIGDVLSNATTRNHADTQALFTFFYDGFSDVVVPLQTSTGVGTTRVAQGAASVAFAAHCRIVVPKQLGRALIVGGTGSGLTNRVLGTGGGAETHTLVNTESPKHTHTWGGSLSATSVTGTATGSANATLSGSTGVRDTQHVHHTEIANLDSSTSMTRGYNLAHAHGGIPDVTSLTSGGFITSAGANYVSFSARHATDNSGDLNHSHYVDPPNTSSGVELGGAYGDGSHYHSLSGTFGGAASINTWTGVTVNGTVGGTTTVMSVGDGAHNNMQPWTAWNIMIRL